jgi:hypothetical protein
MIRAEHHLSGCPICRVHFSDRVAVAFLSALSALIIGGLAWFAFAGLNQAGVQFVVVPTRALWVFVAVMGLAGFFLMENFVLNVVGFIGRVVRIMIMGG